MTTHTFADLGVPAPLVRALAANDITTPFPIQAATLPDSLSGRDVLGRGKTGSGKTLAFSLPLVAALSEHRCRPNRPTGLVLAPTRELATQITAVLQPLASASGLSVTTIFGGVSQNKQVAALRAGADIVVACPGRLEDLMRQKLITLDDVVTTVLDEADHMADLGFLPGVTRILAATPAGGQRLLFSATLDNGVDKLVRRFLSDPVVHSVDEVSAPPAAMTHHVFHVGGVQAKRELVHLLASGTGRRILFMRTKHQARKLAKQLTESGVPSGPQPGSVQQRVGTGSGGHRHRGPRRSRRRRGVGRACRPSDGAQGLSAPVGAHRARRQRRRRRHRGAPGAAQRHSAPAAQGRDLGASTRGHSRVRTGAGARRRHRAATRPGAESRFSGEALRRCAAHVRSAPKRRRPPASAA